MKMREFKDQYWWPLAKSKVRACTLAGYENVYKNHIAPYFANVEMSEITPRIIDSWLDTCFDSPGIARKSFAILRIILRTAYKYEIIDSDPTPRCLKVPKKEYKIQPTLTKDEVEQLINGFHGHELEVWVTLMACLGLRREEGCALTWQDIDLKTGAVNINKGAQVVKGQLVINPPKTIKSYRTVYIPESRLQRIRELAKGSGCITPYNPNITAQKYRRHCKENNLPYVPPKNLRTTFATLALREGWDVGRVSRWMGHSDPSVTLTNYIHPREEELVELSSLFDNLESNKNIPHDEKFFEKLKKLFS